MSFQDHAEALGCDAPRKMLKSRFGKAALAGAIILLSICMVAVAAGALHAEDGFSLEKADAASASVEEADESEGRLAGTSPALYVHVAGSVERPGIYQVEEGARVAEAVQAAGGFTADAATESVNLARQVQDGEQIVVASSTVLDGGHAASGEMGGAVAPKESARADARVNINVATEAELQTISGIGPSKAKKIIAYREANGSFKAVEDICKVSGIGAKTLESIRDQISVG